MATHTERAVLCLEIAYDPSQCDAEGVASALDSLLETAMSSWPDIMDEYGKPWFGKFTVSYPGAGLPYRLLRIRDGALADGQEVPGKLFLRIEGDACGVTIQALSDSRDRDIGTVTIDYYGNQLQVLIQQATGNDSVQKTDLHVLCPDVMAALQMVDSEEDEDEDEEKSNE